MEELFDLTIRLGNELMESPGDVARALREVADRLDRGLVNGAIRDMNGNTVGHYDIHD